MKPIQLLSLALALLSPLTYADSMRCGNQLVTAGDRGFEVERKCGPPEHREVVSYARSYSQGQEVLVEEWVYGPTNGMFRILRFEGNRLVRIESRRVQ
ncbi:uncharacterized protein DUF2845 [Azomonas agilis]|uniref:Uncharacterized protein DUF2845 n=1 Tax=Azomonas agilis TaxID=116849 RepID=A0A562J2N5_9GAMM|nr:DUF2845 domain-containing protein [Azomonas agilis]TWH77380.1 uncharacterized protein DUF2845 [Azomonas agilis]